MRNWIVLSVIMGILLSPSHLLASSDIGGGGEITGKVTDAKSGEVLEGATVVLSNESYQVFTITDAVGLYSLKPIPAGIYQLSVRYVGFEPHEVVDIPFVSDEIIFMDVELSVIKAIADVEVILVGKRPTPYREKIIEPGKTPTGIALPQADLDKMPGVRPVDKIAIASSVYQSDAGEPIQVRGARVGSILNLVDGMKVDDLNNIPSTSIGYLQVLTGGIPAKYGDTTGGVMILETDSYFTLRDRRMVRYRQIKYEHQLEMEAEEKERKEAAEESGE